MNIEPTFREINSKAYEFFEAEIASASAKITVAFHECGDVREHDTAQEAMKSYTKFVRWLFIGDKVYVGPFKSALAFPSPMTFEQYRHYRSKDGWTYEEMAECALDWENTKVNMKGGKKYVLMARTMQNWIDNARNRKPAQSGGFNNRTQSGQVASMPKNVHQ